MFSIWKKLLVLVFLSTLFVKGFFCKGDQTNNAESQNTTAYRLPNDVIPTEYFIRLTPFIATDNFTFDGIVKIISTVRIETSKIVLHVDLMDINNVSILNINEGSAMPNDCDVENITRLETYQFLNIFMKSPISAGTNISIEIVYTGILNTEMYGFFRNSYRVKNETRYSFQTLFFNCENPLKLVSYFYLDGLLQHKWNLLQHEGCSLVLTNPH